MALPCSHASRHRADAACNYSAAQALRLQAANGFSQEDSGMIIEGMASQGAEPTYCMGDDIPLPVLSGRPHQLGDYFKQRFAQARPFQGAEGLGLLGSTRVTVPHSALLHGRRHPAARALRPPAPARRLLQAALCAGAPPPGVPSVSGLLTPDCSGR